jgi:preprotein translocase subunit YajC
MQILHLLFAQAQAPAAGGAGSIAPFLFQIGAIFLIFYFLMIRPQQRQKSERERMLRAIKRGDRVVTTSGLFGTVTNLSDTTVTLRVADQVKLDFERGSIARVVEAQSEKDG